MNIGNAIYGYNLKNNINTGGVPQIAIGTGITSVTAGAVLDLSSNTTTANSSLLLPVGTSAARPTGVNGMLRYNSTVPQVEAYVGGTWTALTGGGGGGGSSNLGTSTSAASPLISGDATSGFYTPAASTVAVTAGGVEVVQWNTLASGVDYLSVTPGKSGTAPSMAIAGTTTNQGLRLSTAGTGGLGLNVAPSTTYPILVGSTTSNGNGALLTAAGVWVNASDRRSKENIRPIEYGLNDVMKLKPVNYDMIDTHDEQIGFIAQDVAEIVPQVVTKTETGRYGLSYGNMVALTVKSIQELKAENDNLKQEISLLKTHDTPANDNKLLIEVIIGLGLIMVGGFVGLTILLLRTRQQVDQLSRKK